MKVKHLFHNENKILVKRLTRDLILWDLITVYNLNSVYEIPKLTKIRVELILPFKSKSDMNIIKSLDFMSAISTESLVKVKRFKKGLSNFLKFSFVISGLNIYSFIFFMKRTVLPIIKKRKLYLNFNAEAGIFNINFKDISDLKDLNLFFDYFNWENLVYVKFYSKSIKSELTQKETMKFFSHYFNKIF